MRLALFQPEIPQNVGTLLRLGACLNVPVDVIEPCGFLLSDKRMKRAGMDYMQHVDWTRHSSWDDFQQKYTGQRRIALDIKGEAAHHHFSFRPDDILLLGQEGEGLPDAVFNACDARVVIPMCPDVRSLNVAVAGAIVLNEALRQTQQFPVHPSLED
ncbi:MAG: tRNA (cytidine(34)-2'-O)-methyltransferase [Holosporaceae bacterium]|nr:MAG: tRNA (cytidine(34)-2'-O)-methyltransferase [Holosporaceae bacterium]